MLKFYEIGEGYFMIYNLEKNMKGALNRKINISLSIAAVFLMTDSISFASSKSLQENYPKDYFENKVSKSINDIVDDNFSKTLIFGLPNPVNIGVKSGIKSIFSILDKKFPELKPLLKLTGYDLNTFPEQKLFHFKELHGQKVAAEFQKTNKAFNEAEKKWAETSHFVMKNKSALDEHEQKIKENTSAIGSLKSNLENNYYAKEEVYSQTEVDTKLGEHDQRIAKNSSAIGSLKSNLENNYYTKEEVYSQMEVDTKLGEHDQRITENSSAIGGLKSNLENNYYTKEEVYSQTEVDTKLGEHDQRITGNSSAIGSLKSNLENNYYTKEEVYSQTEVDTKLGEHDQRITGNSSAIGGLKSNLENNYYTKEEVYSQMEIDTKIDTKVDKKEFYDYQHNIKKDIENTKSEIRHVGSLSAALSGLHPMQYDENNPNQIMASLGSYRDKQAVAVGLTHYFKDNLMMTGGLAVTDDKKIKSMVSLGITYKFGKGGGNIHNTSAHDFGKAFEKLAKENNEQKIQLDKQVKENADLKDIVQNQSQEIQEIKKQLKLLLNKK